MEKGIVAQRKNCPKERLEGKNYIYIYMACLKIKLMTTCHHHNLFYNFTNVGGLFNNFHCFFMNNNESSGDKKEQ